MGLLDEIADSVSPRRMSKRYKGKTCVYCGNVGASDTRDHVLAREFVLERHRANLPVVPACRACNSAKSALESELTVVLPFGARHAAARENLSTMVPKRLRANERLRRQLEETLEPRWVPSPTGAYQMRSMVHIDAEKINGGIAMLTLGLIYHHWNVVVAGQVVVEPMLASPNGRQYMDRLFTARAGRRIAVTSIGGGALTYEAAMGADNPLVSAWRFAIYDGLEIAGEDPCVTASTWYATVLPIGLVNAA